MGYEPSHEQQSLCKRCKWWMTLCSSCPKSSLRCCHYILFNGHMRGPDPCDKFEPKPTSPPKRKVKPTNEEEAEHDEN